MLREKKLKMLSFVLLIVVLVMVAVLSGCAGGGETDTGGDEGSDQAASEPAATDDQDSEAQGSEAGDNAGPNSKKIAALNPWVNTPYQPAFIEYGKKACEDAGYEYVLFDGESDGQKQYDQAKQVIDEGYAAILLSPNDAASGAKIAQLCVDSNMPLATATSEVDTAARDLVTIRVGVTGDYQGKALGDEVVKKFADATEDVNIVSITGTPALEAIQGRSNGFKEAIAQNDHLKLLTEQSADFDKAKAMEIMENYLTTYPDIDVVYCHDDTMANGAIEALKAAGKEPGEVLVIGVGANKEGLQAIKDGWMWITMNQAPDVEGALEAECMIKYLNGEEVPFTEGNYVQLPSPIVTAENADEYDPKW
jgi:ABC-type sugar transport system substrate-binding protein